MHHAGVCSIALMSSHNFVDTILLQNQIMDGKAANDILLEIYSPIEGDMFCGYLEII